MILTDYEMVFPHCGEVGEDGTVLTPEWAVCDVDLVDALADEVLRADWECASTMRDLADYRRHVENQDMGTVGELVMRAERYRSALARSIAELLMSAIAIARLRDITCSDIQLAIDKHAGLAS